jgi:hypothetical protein
MNDQAKYGTQPDRLQARYATPPKKEWVGLTDEEYEAMAEQYVTNCYFDTLKYSLKPSKQS